MGLRDRILAGTALALLIAISPAAFAAGETDKALEAAVPMPEPANVPPPTLADIAPAAPIQKTTAPAAQTPAAPQSAPAPSAPAPAQAQTPAAGQPADAAAIDIKSLTGKDLVKAPIAASLSGADIQVAEKLRDLLAAKSERYFNRKSERAAAEAFYRDRGFAPLWMDKGALSQKATGAIAFLRGVDADALDPADYPAIEIKSSEADALADAELKYTQTIFNFARHAQTGRIHYTRIAGDIAYSLDYPDPAAVLANISGPRTIGEALAGYHPQHAGYRALKAKLAEARGKKDDAPARIADGPVLKIVKTKKGKEIVMEDERVPLLRTRLGLPAEPDNTSYDADLADAVRKFQKQNGLSANGQLNAATLKALNGPKRERDADLIEVNMERWRWMPRELGKAHVMLNVPDFTLKVMNDGKTVWTTKVVVGKPVTATPMLTETMKYITVNPTWNVPPSIINNEYLPALEQDPDALSRIGLKVTENADGTIRIYQPPGEGNALGRIRFNFPNKFLVYQHDTPDKHYFAHEKRAYSHGCMRVQNPDKYAEVLLGLSQPNEGWTAERIRKMYGSAEQNITLAKQIPVHITYQTAFVDDAGTLQIRGDVYGRDGRMVAALKGDARKVADIPMERRETAEKSPVARVPARSQNPFANWFRRDEYSAPRPSREVRRGGERYIVREEPPFFGWFR